MADRAQYLLPVTLQQSLTAFHKPNNIENLNEAMA